MTEVSTTSMFQAPIPADLPHNLESRFGFRSEAFRTYMGLNDMKNRSSATQLAALSEAMQPHDHPLVRYAAGWAMAEAGLWRYPASKKPPSRPTSRQIRLDAADAMWSEAAQGFDASLKSAASDREATGYYSLALHARQTRAALPLMRVAARWFASEVLPAEELEHAINRSRIAQTQEAAQLLDPSIRTRSKECHTVRRAAASNLIANLLLLNQNPVDYLAFPAPLRQIHKPHPKMNSNLLAVRAAGSHPRLQIQVTDSLPSKQVVIHPRRDLLLEPQATVYGTLAAIAANNEGRLDDDYTKQRLGEMTDNLHAALQTFDAERQ